MGASEWEYITPYQGDLAATLDALRHQVFADGNYVSPTEWGLPAPASVEDLLQGRYWEFMSIRGTHSIIDVFYVVPPDDPGQDYGTVRPLNESEYRRLFGVAHPSRADYAPLSHSRALHRCTDGRGTARAAVLWVDGMPNETLFWGYSGD